LISAEVDFEYTDQFVSGEGCDGIVTDVQIFQTVEGVAAEANQFCFADVKRE
jgi:hypothetical protein